MKHDVALSLHIPEARFRPGDTPDFGYLKLPKAGAAKRPAVDATASETRDLAYGLVRVLDDDGKAVGPWDPKLDPATLRRALRDMMLTRAFDDRMFRMQRQGKTSFYMKCTGEEAVAGRRGACARAERHVLPDLSPAGPPDRARLAAPRHDVPDLLERARPAEGPAAAGPLFGARGGLLLARRQSRHASSRRPSAGRWPRPTSATAASPRPGSARARRRKATSTTALTFAAVYHAPVILNLVNNQWAISSSQGVAGGEEATFASRAIGYGIPGIRVDGNDLLAVYAVTRWAADRARSNHGPTLIEHFTYRVDGAFDERRSEPLPARRRGASIGRSAIPIARLKAHLDRARRVERRPPRGARDGSSTSCVRATERRGRRATACSARGRITIRQTMFEDVYKEMPWHLREQQAELAALAEDGEDEVR